MLRRLLILVLAALAAFALAAPAGAAPVFPTGLRVGLAIPPGLVASKRFPGFEDAKHRVAVAILELPGQAYDKLMKSGFVRQTRGLNAVSKADFAIAGGSGYLISGTNTVNGQSAHHWFLLAKPKAGDKSKGTAITGLVRIDVPDAARTIYTDAVVRKMLASTDFRPTPTQELLGLLPFKVGDLAGFRVAHIIPGSVILTDSPAEQGNKIAPPYMIVMIGRGGPRDDALRETFVRDMLRNGPLNDVRVTSSDKIRVDRAPTLEVRADATDPSGKPVRVVQWVRFGTGGFMRVVGISPKDDWDKLFSRFRAVRDGVEPR
ncbi:MAG: hypothetical protein P8Z80_02480 [Pseudolabrys sp.]|jgi:hypothetical protein